MATTPRPTTTPRPRHRGRDNDTSEDDGSTASFTGGDQSTGSIEIGGGDSKAKVEVTQNAAHSTHAPSTLITVLSIAAVGFVWCHDRLH